MTVARTWYFSLWLCVSHFTFLAASPWATAQSSDSAAGREPQLSGPIVLVAGEITKKDTLGHHDYLGGCKCLQMLLQQTPGVEVILVPDAWPSDVSLLDRASAVVFYTDGGGKQAFLSSPERIAAVDGVAKRGAGLVFIHQAVDFPAEVADTAKSWLGGIYRTGKSGRGHWPSSHVDFPTHPITRGVTPWKVKDGWLNGIDFVSEMRGITPLVWSGKVYEGSRSGLDPEHKASLRTSFLLTNKPNIKSIKDFGPNDRIALPSIRVSIQAIVLAMGVEQAFGPGKAGELDNIQVAMAHPEAYAALTSGAGGVTGYMASSPFQERALKLPNITKVADSFSIQGGPATLSVIYAKSDFVDKNPKLTAAFMEAQKKAVAMIKSDLKGSIDKYYAVTKDKTDRAIVEEILSGPNYDFDIFPKESMKIADFMVKTGALKQKPTSWKDYFFATVHGEPGS